MTGFLLIFFCVCFFFHAFPKRRPGTPMKNSPVKTWANRKKKKRARKGHETRSEPAETNERSRYGPLCPRRAHTHTHNETKSNGRFLTELGQVDAILVSSLACIRVHCGNSSLERPAKGRRTKNGRNLGTCRRFDESKVPTVWHVAQVFFWAIRRRICALLVS